MRSTFDLAADFAEAEATGERRDLVQQLTRVDLLVLEDFGMKKLASNAAEDLLEVFVRRHETASTLITTKSADARLGRVSRRRARRDGDSRSLPRPRDESRVVSMKLADRHVLIAEQRQMPQGVARKFRPTLSAWTGHALCMALFSDPTTRFVIAGP